MSMEATMAGLPAPLQMTVSKRAPDYYAEVQSIPGIFEASRTYAKGKATQKGPQGNGEVVGEELADLQSKAATIFSETLYFTDGYSCVLEGVNKLDGKSVYQLAVTTPNGEESTEYYDVNTGLKVREESSQETPQGPVTVATIIKDYKAFDGVKFPSDITQDLGPQKLELKLLDVKTNKAVSVDIFKL